MFAYHVIALLAQSPSTDPLSGGAGWVGAGLLGAVLAWVMFVHLPGKDRLMMSILEKQAAEREIERASRHGVANKLQQAIAEIVMSHAEESKENRENFAKVIEMQTLRFEKALSGSCSWYVSDRKDKA